LSKSNSFKSAQIISQQQNEENKTNFKNVAKALGKKKPDDSVRAGAEKNSKKRN